MINIQGKTTFGPRIITDGLILYIDSANYDCYSGGTICRDLLKNSYGNLINGISFTNNYGGSFFYDGTDDYIDINSAITYNYSNTEGFSVDMWYNWDGTTVSNYACLFNGFGRLLISNVRTYLLQNGNGNFFSTAGVVQINTWNHVNITFNKSENMEYIYHNGVLVGSKSRTTTYSLNLNSITIGFYDLIYYRYRGYISNFKIYNKPLSYNQVLQNYKATKKQYY